VEGTSALLLSYAGATMLSIAALMFLEWKAQAPFFLSGTGATMLSTDCRETLGARLLGVMFVWSWKAQLLGSFVGLFSFLVTLVNLNQLLRR
jgi:hypothetical protein